MKCGIVFLPWTPHSEDGKVIKKFWLTCYSGWMASSDMFNGFTIDLDILSGIVQASFAATWPISLYIPC